MEKPQGKIIKKSQEKVTRKNLTEGITRKSHGKRLKESQKKKSQGKIRRKSEKMSQGKITMK